MEKAVTYHLRNFLDFGRPMPKAWNKDQAYLCLSYVSTSKEKNVFVVGFRDLNLFIFGDVEEGARGKKNPL